MGTINCLITCIVHYILFYVQHKNKLKKVWNDMSEQIMTIFIFYKPLKRVVGLGGISSLY